MNLGEAKKRALSLMAEYSIDGTLISDRENADYLVRMNFFANDAQMEISDKVGIEASVIYELTASAESGYNSFDLPSDYKQLRKVLYNDEPFTNFRILNNQFLTKKELGGRVELIYFRNPLEITAETPDSYEFEVDRHTHSFIPYFIGGMAIHDENPSIGDRLLNIYFSRMNVAEKKIEDEIHAIYSINWL